MSDYWRESFEKRYSTNVLGGSIEHYDYINTIINNVLNTIGPDDRSIRMKYGNNIDKIKKLLNKFHEKRSKLEIFKGDRYNTNSLKSVYDAIHEVNDKMNDKSALLHFIGTMTSICEDLEIPELRKQYQLNEADYSTYMRERMNSMVSNALGIKPAYCKLTYLLLLHGTEFKDEYKPIIQLLINLYYSNINDYRPAIITEKDYADYPDFLKSMLESEKKLINKGFHKFADKNVTKYNDVLTDVPAAIKGEGLLSYDDIIINENDDETENIENVEGAGRRRRRRKTRKGRGIVDFETDNESDVEGAGRKRRRRKTRKGRGIEEEQVEDTKGGAIKLKGWTKRGKYYYNSKGTKRTAKQIQAMKKFKKMYSK